MQKLKDTLKSRKFWVAVASSALLAMTGEYEAAIGVWLGWATLEGYIDAQRAKQGEAIAGILVEKTDKGE
jgi:hypothetical protein